LTYSSSGNGINIKGLRDRRRDKFATRAGISEGDLSDVELGRPAVTIDFLVRVLIT
jgi:hypothetical protein